jgi:mannose-6-phosphate isomerase-like protein (cupin superfamily)
MSAINLEEKLALFSEYWSPKIVARYNGNDIMVVKVKGEFQWHSHADTDDLFLVLKGRLEIRLRKRDCDARARRSVCRTGTGGALSGRT